MFGKPEWFEKKSVGWGIKPVNWRGWAYAMVWMGVLCIPFVLLLAQAKVWESLIWVVVMMFALLWDVRHVRQAYDAPAEAVIVEPEEVVEEADDVLIIDEDTEPDPAHFATRSYDLHVRR
jgi:hypothetical protein